MGLNKDIIMADTTNILKEEQLKYLGKSYKVGKDTQENETVNILNDYAWTLDSSVANANSVALNPGEKNNSSYSIEKKNNIPFCYVVERRSAANAGIANIFNLINHIKQTANHALGAIESLISGGKKKSSDAGTDKSNNDSNTAENNTETANTGGENKKSDEETAKSEQPDANTQKQTEGEKVEGNTLKDFGAELKKFFEEATSGLKDLLAQNNLSNDFLLPYKFLYITKATGKKYVFPLLNNSASFSQLKNTWGNGAKLPGFLQKAVDGVYGMVDTVAVGLNVLDNTKNFLSGKGDDVGYIREMAKSYQYPQDGDDVMVNFTLYNTTRLNAWKENYKFLFLFVLRNLPLRVNVASFVPPVLYDVVIPGIKHLPVCSVSGINVVPKGLIRTLTMENFMGEGNMIVNVPEAWEVTITFKCLIGRSANLILSGINSALNITTSSSNETTTEPAATETAQTPQT